MSDLATALAEVLATASPVPIPTTAQHIEGPAADRLLWDPVEAGSPALQTLVTDHPDWPGFPALLRDVFFTYYKLFPELRAEDAVDPAYRPNRRWVSGVLHDATTETTRALTRLNDLMAAIATVATATDLAHQIANDPDLADTMQPPAPPESDPAIPPDPVEPVEPVEPAADPSDPPQMAGRLHKAVRHAVRAGEAGAQSAQDVLAAWGLTPADLATMPMGDRLTFVARLHTPKLQALARLVGRMRGLARARQRLRLQRGHDERIPMTLGNDLGRVFPSALVHLRHPVLHRDFARRFAEGTLPEYDLRPQPRTRQGPMLAAVDISGSMAGEPLDWAVAVALGLSDCARQQHRPFAVCVFNTDVKAAWFAPRGALSPSDLMALATVGVSGGTAFQAPLQWALDQLGTTRWAVADLALITDGQNHLPSAFRERLLAAKATTGLRIFTVAIGAQTTEVEHWSDAVWPLQHLTYETGQQTAQALFDHVGH